MVRFPAFSPSCGTNAASAGLDHWMVHYSTKRFFRLLTHTLKSSSCVALLDVVEKSSIGQNATTTSRSVSAVT